MATKEEILRKLRKNKNKIERFGVKRVGIFGSFARDEAREKSDIDVVVEFERGKATFKNEKQNYSFLLWCRFKHNLGHNN